MIIDLYTRVRVNHLLPLLLLGLVLVFAVGCEKQPESLTVYAGKGLKNVMAEVKNVYEQQEGIPVHITYAGSNTLLNTLRNTRKGDVFIPGSLAFIKKAGELAGTPQYVAQHIPGFIVSNTAKKRLNNYSDLLSPEVRIAIGNKDMCAIGKVGEAILNDAEPHESFRSNIVVTGSTVNELLNLVVDQEVDAALIWANMSEWPEAKGLGYIAIPPHINKPEEIWVSALTVSSNPQQATHFANFVASKSKEIFFKHGFSAR